MDMEPIRPNRGLPTNEMLVVVPIVQVEFGVVHDVGNETYGYMYEPGPTYHMMRRNKSSHLFEMIPNGFPESFAGLQMNVSSAIPVRESWAILWGLKRCQDCAWPSPPASDPASVRKEILERTNPRAKSKEIANGEQEENLDPGPNA